MTHQDFDIRSYSHELSAAVLEDATRLAKHCFGIEAVKNDLTDRIAEKHKPLLIVAYQDEAAVGFKLGYETSRGVFFSWLGGIHPDYRRRGLAQKMLRQQHAWCVQNGYHTVTTESGNAYKGMMILNLVEGFQITGTRLQNDGSGLNVLFSKML
jgi:ribosomal protein S18 acetylase RimI-like enzyme